MPNINITIDPQPNRDFDSPEEAAEAIKAEFMGKPFTTGTVMQMRARLEPYGLTCSVDSMDRQSVVIYRMGDTRG